ncbi:hypothetical protein K3495_g4944 [Podosphaera aphanis]|nr:hypothetical protein K3495_g4944 [Podosphaera aphanis]
MVPQVLHDSLSKRYYCDFDGFCYRTSWDTWGRWVAFAVAAITIALLAFLFSCQSNRRRRNHGLPPMYGTGWIPGSKPPSADNYNVYASYAGAPAPPYTASPYTPPKEQQFTGTAPNTSASYYGNHTGHNSGIELQPPQSSYQPPRVDELVYAAPPGPPPLKN